MISPHSSSLLYITSLWALLLGAVATLFLVAGLSGYVASLSLNVVTAGATLLVMIFFLYSLFSRMVERSRLGVALWLLILGVLLSVTLLSLVPPTARDELTHHLAMPRLYAKAGQIRQIPFAPYSYYPMLLEMLYTPWVRWGWDSVPKLIHALFGFLTALLIYDYLTRRLNSVYGLLGFFFFVSTPAILRLSSWAYVDLGMLFYSTASLLCLLRWSEKGERRIANGEWDNSQSAIRGSIPLTTLRISKGNPQSSLRNCRWLAVSGLLAGFAVATKPNGLLVFLLLFLVLIFLMGKAARRDAGAILGQALLFALLALIPLSPWLLKNLAWTGNPFFPFFGELFGGGVGGEGEPGLGILARRRFLYGESWWQIAALPLRIFFSGRDDVAQYFDGVLNPMLVLFLPWAFKGKWVEEKRVLFGFALFYFLYAAFLAEMRIRYILPIVAPLVILLVYGLHNVYLRIARPALLFAAVIFLAAMNGIYFWNYFHKVSALDYLAGKESRAAYLTRVLPEYPALQFINQRLPSTAKVYFLFVGRRVYYCERDYFHDGGDYAGTLLRMIRSARDQDALQAKLQGLGLTHLLSRDDLLARFLSANLSPGEARLWVSFANNRLRRLFYSRGYSVYQIHG